MMPAPLSTAVAPFNEHAGRWLEAAEREAPLFLALHGAVPFDFVDDGQEPSRPHIVELTLDRIIDAAEPSAVARVTRVDDAIGAAKGDRVTVSGEDVWSGRTNRQRAAYFLGLAIGRLLAGGR
jgi:hypothetical protein